MSWISLDNQEIKHKALEITTGKSNDKVSDLLPN